ncbi:MAG: CpsB/CapC family capsule biosynthesis tyrosine phosphatase [Lachnospiraceae bacterium]
MFIRRTLEEGFVDLHTHVIPYTDDGASDSDTALWMLTQAYEEGTRTLVATPHFHPAKVRCDEDAVYQNFLQLKEEASKRVPGIRLEYGRECLCNYAFLEALEKNANDLSLCHTSYVLVEFNVTDEFTYIKNAVRRIQMCGYIPVIAHVERYLCLSQSMDYIEDLFDMNVILQVNAMSVTGAHGRFTQKLVMKLIKKGFVHVVASDAHSTGRRNAGMKEAVRMVCKKFGETKARELFIENPYKIIEGKYLEDK